MNQSRRSDFAGRLFRAAQNFKLRPQRLQTRNSGQSGWFVSTEVFGIYMAVELLSLHELRTIRVLADRFRPAGAPVHAIEKQRIARQYQITELLAKRDVQRSAHRIISRTFSHSSRSLSQSNKPKRRIATCDESVAPGDLFSFLVGTTGVRNGNFEKTRQPALAFLAVTSGSNPKRLERKRMPRMIRRETPCSRFPCRRR